MKNQMYSLVSVIIPVYNEEDVIGRLLDSINKQTYPHLEVIVIDDASCDKTAIVAKQHGAKVYLRKHAERSVQRNFGAKASHGSLLVFLDADMELTTGVIKDAVSVMQKGYSALVISEKTAGDSFISRIRKFEREMYMGDPTVEVARVFDRKVFFEFGGYDKDLTGPEDYDLPYRISKKYKIGRSSSYILHHEEEITLTKLLGKKYYYAKNGALYATKHPELLRTQGNILFRKAYFKNWKKFLASPLIGFSFILVRVVETISAILGYISAVGISRFLISLRQVIIVEKEK